MAAQKLTRGRFVQIIIMLTVLIVAFTWRTIEHQTTKKITCEVNTRCAFYVNNSLFELELNEQEVVLETENLGWNVTEVNNIQLQSEQDTKWIFNPYQGNAEISFKLYKLNETMATKIEINGK